MSCGVFEALVSARLDGPIQDMEERALDAHLARCRACREREEELLRLRELLVSGGNDELPDDLGEQLFSRIGGGEGRASSLRRLLERFPAVTALPAVVPSTLLAVLLVFAAQAHLDPVSALPRSADAPVAASHREASLLTVWDSSADTIAVALDPTGLAGRDAMRRAIDPASGSAVSAGSVRMFLYTRIVVRG